MSKRESTARLILIVNKLRKKPSSLKEILDFLDKESDLQGYNYRISPRTFQRDLEDIRSLYNIDIQYNFSSKLYYLESEDQKDMMQERILEAFDIFNALNVTDRISKYIHFEKRRPQGTENLYGLIHAIKNTKCIAFTYAKFWDDFTTKRTIEPYALKEFRNRWYIIGKDLKDSSIKTFALDRLTEFQILHNSFVYPTNFNIEKHFEFCFGIISPNDEQPQKITLSFDAHQGKYIKTLPLHETQRIIKDTEDGLQIELTLSITHDFIMEILSYGDTLKILKPIVLKETIKEILVNTLNQYKDINI
jgi:predicted DNA-binding transcriptional regulator YafY